ncbi:MAG: SDR family oxidoreductase [Anaerolineae bacterium]|nr:SDR family oxidoreductase [Anaerolineae bacterium]
MKILITGASGLLGINLALVAARQHTVFGTLNSQKITSEAFTVIETDLLEPSAVDRVLDKCQPDWVIHCAALANLEACEDEPELAWQLNTELPRNLAKQCRQGGARLLHVSTDAVFDGQRGSYTELDAPNPLSVYSQTKLAAESAVVEAHPEAIIARVNLFGWSIRGQRSLAEFFFNNLQMGNPMMGFIDLLFCPLLVNDIAEIFLMMLQKELRGLYHVVSCESISKYDFGTEIARIFGFDPGLIIPTSVAESSLSAPRSPNLTLKVDKLIHDLGSVPPKIFPALDRFYTLYQQGYPQALKNLRFGITEDLTDEGSRT